MNELEPPTYEFDDFRVDAVRRLLLRSGEVAPLTPKVFDTLLFFVRHRGRVLGKEELMGALWPDAFVEENNLTQSVSSLRRALGEAKGELYEALGRHRARAYRRLGKIDLAPADELTASKLRGGTATRTCIEY